MGLGVRLLKDVFLLDTKMLMYMAIFISTVNGIFPLHTRIQIIIFSIPMCYVNGHDVDIFLN